MIQFNNKNTFFINLKSVCNILEEYYEHFYLAMLSKNYIRHVSSGHSKISATFQKCILLTALKIICQYGHI